jgi:hypothetical protein
MDQSSSDIGDVGGGAIHAFTYANQTLLDATEWMRSLNGPGSLGAMAFNLGMVPQQYVTF